MNYRCQRCGEPLNTAMSCPCLPSLRGEVMKTDLGKSDRASAERPEAAGDLLREVGEAYVLASTPQYTHRRIGEMLPRIAAVLAAETQRSSHADGSNEKETVGAQVGAAPPLTDLSEKYYELLYAVGNKYPGESRHETALRYIRRAEINSSEAGSAMQHPSGGDQRTEGSGLSDRAQAEAVRRPVGGECE